MTAKSVCKSILIILGNVLALALCSHAALLLSQTDSRAGEVHHHTKHQFRRCLSRQRILVSAEDENVCAFLKQTDMKAQSRASCTQAACRDAAHSKVMT